jgi:hypothetical protein
MNSFCFNLILSFPLLLSSVGSASAQDVPQTKEELSPEVRKKYETLYGELTKTQQEIEQALQDAYQADPALKRAVDEYDRATRITSKTSTNQRQKVRKYYKDQRPDVYKQFETWKRCREEVLDIDVVKQFVKDPEMRTISRFAYELVTERKRQRAEEQKESSESDQTDEGEQSFEDYLKSLDEKAPKLTEKCRQYERQLNPPQFVRDYVRENHYGNVLITLSDIYITKKTPERITTLRKRHSDLCEQLDDVWSYWRHLHEKKLRQREKAKARSRQSRV